MRSTGVKPSGLKALAQWAFATAATPAFLGPAVALGPLKQEASQVLSRQWAELVLGSLGIEVHTDDRSGLNGRGGVLYVDLFQQTLLPAIVYPVAFYGRATPIINFEFAVLPFIGWSAAARGAVVLVRQRPEQAKAALARVTEDLRAGTSFAISIEGRRSTDGGLSPYKKGPVVLAIEAQCDIVPFISHGEWALWPRGQWKVKSGRVDVVYYPPLSTKGLTYGDRDDVVAQLRQLAEREVSHRG